MEGCDDSEAFIFHLNQWINPLVTERMGGNFLDEGKPMDFLELNGTHALEAKEKGEDFTPTWLKEGDTIELKIDGLGILKNKIVKAKESYSILAKKKR